MGFWWILAASAALATEAVEVDGAVLATLAHDYDGRRVRTEMSKMAVLTSKAMGCSKDEVTIQLGPKLRMGQAPAVTTTMFALCLPRTQAAEFIPLPMGTGLVIEADVTVKGPKTMPRITMTGAVITKKLDMNGLPIE